MQTAPLTESGRNTFASELCRGVAAQTWELGADDVEDLLARFLLGAAMDGIVSEVKVKEGARDAWARRLAKQLVVGLGGEAAPFRAVEGQQRPLADGPRPALHMVWKVVLFEALEHGVEVRVVAVAAQLLDALAQDALVLTGHHAYGQGEVGAYQQRQPEVARAAHAGVVVVPQLRRLAVAEPPTKLRAAYLVLVNIEGEVVDFHVEKAAAIPPGAPGPVAGGRQLPVGPVLGDCLGE
mmetsp:Transcript_1935/g.5705  ORF Transcript_1935/g.5705 Transcript_1935/m.5705 type:complete len:238 (+) Transcript_1935:742-1455(+)